MTYHSSISTLNVEEFENMLSYAPILVKIASIGARLGVNVGEGWFISVSTELGPYRADFAGTYIPNCAII